MPTSRELARGVLTSGNHSAPGVQPDLQTVEGIPSILTMTICMLNYYYTCCYVCSSRESRTVVDRGFLYI